MGEKIVKKDTSHENVIKTQFEVNEYEQKGFLYKMRKVASNILMLD